MVFKPINLARQSLLKTFTHGYAQSILAASQSTSASQSSSASQNTAFHNAVGFFRSNQNGTQNQLQSVHHAYQSASSQAGPGAKTGHGDPGLNDGGLAAYLAAWQRHQQRTDDRNENEWHQLKFSQRIGWQAPMTILESRIPEPSAVQDVSETPNRTSIRRTKSESALNELASARDLSDEVARDVIEASPEAVAEGLLAQEASTSQASLAESAPETSYARQLAVLTEQQCYEEVLVVFQHMIDQQIQPSTAAYNSLILATTHIQCSRHLKPGKAYDVYRDMLQRLVSPDTQTYDLMIELFASRASDREASMRMLQEKKTRFGNDRGFLLPSDTHDMDVWADDKSLGLAFRFFKTAAADSALHILRDNTYHLLITELAKAGRVNDMKDVVSYMNAHSIAIPPASWPEMITAFARGGDLRGSIDAYKQYRALFVEHAKEAAEQNVYDEFLPEVYAALVKAYDISGDLKSGLAFMRKVETSVTHDTQRELLQGTVYSETLMWSLLAKNEHFEALNQATEKLSGASRRLAFAEICVDAADKNTVAAAESAFKLIGDSTTYPAAAEALFAMHIRLGNFDAGSALWKMLLAHPPNASLIEPTAMLAGALVSQSRPEQALFETRQMFAHLRQLAKTDQDVKEQMDEAMEVIMSNVLEANPVVSPMLGMSMLNAMVESGMGFASAYAEQIVSCFGSCDVEQLAWNDLRTLATVQSDLILAKPSLNAAHHGRFLHLVDLIMTRQLPVDQTICKAVENGIKVLGREDFAACWNDFIGRSAYQPTPVAPAFVATPVSPTQTSAFSAFSGTPPTTVSVPISVAEEYNPFAASTDTIGSSLIVHVLEKSSGKHSRHLNEALDKLKDIRRAGRHPTFDAYAKLIAAAGRERRLDLAREMMALAERDMPLHTNAHVSAVHQGWVNLLDQMISACLTMNKRAVADEYRKKLSSIGGAPTANTYGLYIETLKKTNTTDEATEAVKIFQQAQREGVAPSSFLYNNLIGKLSKARRVDDCLQYYVEMRKLGIKPTSITYGTVIGALLRVSDDKLAEQLFDEMEGMKKYEARPAPYNNMMQFFVKTKPDRAKALAYYQRMKDRQIQPTTYTYKLLVEAYASIAPFDMDAAEAILDDMRRAGIEPEPAHYATLIRAKGCNHHDVAGARELFDKVLSEGKAAPEACLYQALFESYVAAHDVAATSSVLDKMPHPLTAYVANPLIRGWAAAGNVTQARAIYDRLGIQNREPSTYEEMTRAYVANDGHGHAMSIVGEALRRGYPRAVANKICGLVSHSNQPIVVS